MAERVDIPVTNATPSLLLCKSQARRRSSTSPTSFASPEGEGFQPSPKGTLIYYHAARNFELFNLAEDIGETTELSAKYPARVRQLADLLTRYLKNVGAQMPSDKRTGHAVEWPADAAHTPALSDGLWLREDMPWRGPRSNTRLLLPIVSGGRNQRRWKDD